jgi:crotonobetainyl-CoA:carnitine CoA-transferase CaiB-like acyl-CoA transferase
MMENQKAWRPLEGVKIADFSMLLPGPLTTAILADLGAEVVKIEPPAGDSARTLLPDLFRAINRNKRSVVLDLKSPDSREAVQEIAQWADIVIETFRPGVADRLGVGFGQLAAFNPHLVYCSLSGYGQDGPWKDRPGHNMNYLAAAGGLAFPGAWGWAPASSSLPIADISGGAFAASAILAALRECEKTGQPKRLDLSLFESALFCAALRHSLEENADNTIHLFANNSLFMTADGAMITLALLEEHFWENFRTLASRIAPALRQVKFDTPAGRRQHGDELYTLMCDLIRSRSVDAWRELLQDKDVPFEVCITPAEAARSVHVAARGRITEQAGQQFVPFPVTVNDDMCTQVHSAAPALGEYTQDFFTMLRTQV